MHQAEVRRGKEQDRVVAPKRLVPRRHDPSQLQLLLHGAKNVRPGLT